MSDHNIDILLRAKDQASKAIRGVNNELSRTGRLGATAGKGARTAARNLAGVGVIAAAGIAVAVKSGLEDLATLESAITSVDGAIKTVGLTGKVTGAEIAAWANDIERDIGAAFDDKDITAATTTLIRYGKVTDKNIRPAMEVMTDLAAKVGSVAGASSLLAKSLADPTKAAGKLARQGIILTKQQQKQIAAMVEAGDVAGAQAVLLDAVAESTKGAAAASQGPYARSLKVLADVSEDARKALAVGFLPVIEKVADLLSGELGKKDTLKNIENFGKGLASGLDDLIDIARTLPWAQIGDSLKIAGAGGKAILSAFSSMPPWVQTAVLTGWGLNKLTGGALGEIAGELGKGLIKGVLGMNAGVVNIKAGVVNGGGVGGAAGAGGMGKAGKALAGLAIVGEIAAVVAVQQEVSAQNSAIAADIHTSLTSGLNVKTPAELTTALAGVNQGINDIQANPLNVLVSGSALDELRAMRSELEKAQVATGGDGSKTNLAGGRGGPGGGKDVVPRKLDQAKAATDLVKESTDKGTEVGKQGVVAEDRTRSATQTAGIMGANASTRAGSTVATTSVGNTGRIVGAIYAARPVVSTNVNVYVSGSSVTQQQTTTTRTGGTATSRSNDNIDDHR